MERTNLMLAALSSAGRDVTFAPVQVQKLFFIIDREIPALVGGPHFAFRPYDYGPFDRTVYEELESLASLGLVNLENRGTYRVYSLTPAGFAEGVRLSGQLGDAARLYIQQVANWVRTLNFQQLVASIYKVYPDMKVNSVFRQ